MRLPLVLLIAMVAAKPAQAAVQCALTAMESTSEGRFRYALRVDADGLALVGATVHENGEDVVLEVRAGERYAVSDVAPTRYAIERATLPVLGSARFTVEVRGFVEGLKKPPAIEPLCIAWGSARFAPLSFWHGLTGLVHISDAEAIEPGRLAARRTALAVADAFRAYVAARGGDPQLLAGALHIQGYLLSRIGEHAGARERFEAARAAWAAAKLAAPAAAARFNVAQESLALGNVSAAQRELAPLQGAAVERRFPGIAAWAKNDHCLSLRSQNRRDAAVACFADLVPQLDALGERKEAANAVCNWGAALGNAGRWRSARAVLARCDERRRAIGAPAGMAHAELLLGWLALETGTVDDATAHFEASLAHARRTGNAGAVWDAQRWLAQAWLDGDELPRAREAIERIKPDAVQDASRNAHWHAALAYVALLDDDVATAAGHYAEAVSRYTASGQTMAAVGARCEWALIDPAQPIAPECDPLTAASASARRGDVRDAERRLSRAESRTDRELLRRFLRRILARPRTDADAIATLLGQARLLPQDSARERATRGQLLARMSFELAAHAEVDGDSRIARLALGGAWLTGASAPNPGQRLTRGGDGHTAMPRAPEHETLSIPPATVVVASTSFLGTAYLVVGRSDRVVVYRVDSARLAAAIDRWRAAIVERRDATDEAREVAGHLRLAEWWSAADRRLVLAVHGRLATMPWSALAIDDPRAGTPGYTPLIAQADVVHVVAAASPARAEAPTGAIVFYPDASDPGLPGSAAERQLIEAAASAQGWRVGGRPASGYVLHIDSHAMADPRDARANTLLIERANRLAPLEFPFALARDARLVVLAGCDTGVGPNSRWTNPASLASRAIDGGAGAALAHLWPIEDMSAVRLHDAFYREVLAGHEAGRALGAAQRAQLRNPMWRQPRYWASPVLLVRRDAALRTD